MKKLGLILGICLIGSIVYGMLIGEDLSLPQSNTFVDKQVELFLDSDSSQSSYIKGRSFGYGWTIDIQGNRGTIQMGRDRWDIEYFGRTDGLGIAKHSLNFIGRKDDNFAVFAIYVDDSGRSFFVETYDYKEAKTKGDRFSGEYYITEDLINNPNPTYIPGYIPRGKVPDHRGHNFYIDSPYVQMTPEKGHLSYHERGENLELDLWPCYNVIVTTSWEEIWTLGVDSRTNHSYLIIFYTTTPSAWVIDLWDLSVEALPLGQVKITGGEITVPHHAVLGE
jgi:hypothetical protein